MSSAEPRILILNGEDEFAIAQEVAKHQTVLEKESPAADLNFNRLDGPSFNLDQLLSIAGALPFLARRRLVILINGLVKLDKSSENPEGKQEKESRTKEREKLCKLFENLPPTTLLILVENRFLTDPRERKKQKFKLHWLEKWAAEKPEIAVVKTFARPKGGELVGRIQQAARDAGGQITRDAALHLANRVDDDLRRASQEIEKLLAFVNYSRQVTYEDVEEVTADDNEGNVFALIDSMAAKQMKAAMENLERMLDYNDYYMIFGSITSHFRKLILARAVIDEGGQNSDVQKVLKAHPFFAEKVANQARLFKTAQLETAYHLLLEIDRAKKTSQAGDELGLEFFISAFIAAPHQKLLTPN